MYCDEYGGCYDISIFGPTPVYGLFIIVTFAFIAFVVYQENKPRR